ncbi:MAG: hypothetical protein EOO15_15645 [Chitinophagaceae bacterium]|nr:MAG: hypothetical protein EOO15_15645 [Chitinophagaceae bacterium]
MPRIGIAARSFIAILCDFYNKASFSVIELNPMLNGNAYSTHYLITNESTNAATNIEVAFQVLATDSVQLAFNQNLQLITKPNGPTFKDCNLKVDRLVPKEGIVIMIHSKADSIKYYNTKFSENVTIIPNEAMAQTSKHHSPLLIKFPHVTFAKFDKGFGEIHELPRVKLLSIIDKIPN